MVAVVEVRGRGLMLAIEYREPIARQVAVELARAGVLAKETHGRIIRLMPPLVIADADIDAAMTNICRCGTYQQVREAIHAAAKA